MKFKILSTKVQYLTISAKIKNPFGGKGDFWMAIRPEDLKKSFPRIAAVALNRDGEFKKSTLSLIAMRLRGRTMEFSSFRQPSKEEQKRRKKIMKLQINFEKKDDADIPYSEAYEQIRGITPVYKDADGEEEEIEIENIEEFNLDSNITLEIKRIRDSGKTEEVKLLIMKAVEKLEFIKKIKSFKVMK